jgi:hypothetical protein
MHMLKNRHLYGFAVLTLIVGAGISNYALMKSDDSIIGSGSPNHLVFSIVFFDRITAIMHNHSLPIAARVLSTARALGESINGEPLWPNGLNLTASFFYSAFGRSLFSAKLSLLPYLCILIFSTYQIGRLMISPFAGCISAYLVFMSPLIFTSSRQFQLDFPLSAMVALSIALLLASDTFKQRKYSFLFGLALGWMLLIKVQGMSFIMWPLLVVGSRLFMGYIRKGAGATQVKNFALSVLLPVS